MRLHGRLRRRARVLMLLIGAALAACGREPRTVAIQVPGGDPEQGPAVMRFHGCYVCHTIEGVVGADGKVGPPLDGIGERQTIAGQLSNTPDNLVRWIMNPQAIDPGNAMPNMGLTEEEARHAAAYLYSIR